MKKIKLLLEYDGTAYQGWQIQKECITIQGIIEEKILKITGEQSRVIGAGRTDAGVPALGQVAAFRTISRLEPEAIKRALNALLPYVIRVIETFEVNDSFHPIYDAVKKSYFYIIANQREFPAFLYRYAWIVRQPLEMKYMIEAAQTLIGRHDFSSFMGTGSSIKDPEREIFSLSLDKLDNIDFMTASMRGEFIKIGIEANGFLRHMVRNIAGTLVEIGRGRISPDRMKEILELHDRKCAGQTAPPNGLFLGRIMYY